MKILPLLFLALSTCTSKIIYHHGFIYDYSSNKPLKGVKVSSQFDIDINSTTDDKGHLKIQKNILWSKD